MIPSHAEDEVALGFFNKPGPFSSLAQATFESTRGRGETWPSVAKKDRPRPVGPSETLISLGPRIRMCKDWMSGPGHQGHTAAIAVALGDEIAHQLIEANVCHGSVRNGVSPGPSHDRDRPRAHAVLVTDVHNHRINCVRTTDLRAREPVRLLSSGA